MGEGGKVQAEGGKVGVRKGASLRLARTNLLLARN